MTPTQKFRLLRACDKLCDALADLNFAWEFSGANNEQSLLDAYPFAVDLEDLRHQAIDLLQAVRDLGTKDHDEVAADREGDRMRDEGDNKAEEDDQ